MAEILAVHFRNNGPLISVKGWQKQSFHFNSSKWLVNFIIYLTNVRFRPTGRLSQTDIMLKGVKYALSVYIMYLCLINTLNFYFEQAKFKVF